MSPHRVLTTADGAILYDAGRWPAPPEPTHFDPAWFRERDAALGEAVGRGTAFRVRTPAGDAVLRHYRRGGRVAPLLGDRYLWTGLERTRAFREYRVLARAHADGLPVPAPLAARVSKRGGFYRADLLVSLVEHAETLAQRLHMAGRVPWRAIGATIARMHAHGLWHADLNAHNVLLAREAVWLIDFDRARYTELSPMERRANVARLERSLRKLGAPSRVARFDDALRELHAGYAGAGA